MPRLTRPDGAEIHWEERGEGPLVALGGYWSMHPSVFDALVAELEGDHRVVRYDDRGAGQSSRVGPYDLDTAADDLAAVIEEAGGPAVVVCTADASNRAVRVLAGDPGLVEAVVGVGGAPLGRRAFADSDVLVASATVVDALQRQVESDYRGALRAVLTATNPQMSEEELRDRVTTQIAYYPHEAAVARLHAWVDDDPLELARAAGDRVWIAVAPDLGGGWFPAGPELARRVRPVLPEAHVVEIADGFMSRPDETARVVRMAMTRRGALEPSE